MCVHLKFSLNALTLEKISGSSVQPICNSKGLCVGLQGKWWLKIGIPIKFWPESGKGARLLVETTAESAVKFATCQKTTDAIFGDVLEAGTKEAEVRALEQNRMAPFPFSSIRRGRADSPVMLFRIVLIIDGRRVAESVPLVLDADDLWKKRMDTNHTDFERARSFAERTEKAFDNFFCIRSPRAVWQNVRNGPPVTCKMEKDMLAIWLRLWDFGSRSHEKHRWWSDCLEDGERKKRVGEYMMRMSLLAPEHKSEATLNQHIVFGLPFLLRERVYWFCVTFNENCKKTFQGLRKSESKSPDRIDYIISTWHMIDFVSRGCFVLREPPLEAPLSEVYVASAPNSGKKDDEENADEHNQKRLRLEEQEDSSGGEEFLANMDLACVVLDACTN